MKVRVEKRVCGCDDAATQHNAPGTTAMNLKTVEIKAFVPARDFAQAKAFYQALGATIAWSDDELAYCHIGDCSFLLQNFHVDAHSANFVMHLLVHSADDWHAHVSGLDLPARFPGARVGELKNQPWRMREFPIWDPTGVLWLVVHNLDGEADR